VPSPKQVAGLHRRLSLLQAEGISAAPTLEGPEIPFKKSGTFRIYSAEHTLPFEGTAAALRKWIEGRGLKSFVVQRIPEPLEGAIEYVLVSTRDPRTGADVPVGEFYADNEWYPLSGYTGSEEHLADLCKGVERVLKDVCLVEAVRYADDEPFCVLSVFPAVRSVGAALAFVRDFADEEILTREEAILRISPADMAALETQTLSAPEGEAIAKGSPAVPGVAYAPAAWSAQEAMERFAVTGDRSVLAVKMTGPEDVAALQFCSGIVTETGGLTSHAAVVARGMGLPCIVSADRIGQRRGEEITLSIDGSTGLVFEGKAPVSEETGTLVLDEVLQWVPPAMSVYANVDTPDGAKDAVGAYGAAGVGLCRTEHQFFGADRIEPFRRMLIADTDALRKAALIRLLEFQRDDFKGIFDAAGGRPVTIRLLDAPLHEFWSEDAAQALGVSKTAVKRYVETLHESNPMLGHRGCRYGITAPEVYAMQVQAVAEAALAVHAEVATAPRIMIPLVASVREFIAVRSLVEDILTKVMGSEGKNIPIGTMIETPRACITADEIAREADFLSFGTNDLTQMVWGYSRDDVEKWMPKYLDLRVLQANPFATLDVRGVGRLIRLGVELARAVRPTIEIGVCGEHAADPRSISAFAHLGVDYISCSVSRLKMARLAAAQVAVRGRETCISV